MTFFARFKLIALLSLTLSSVACSDHRPNGHPVKQVKIIDDLGGSNIVTDDDEDMDEYDPIAVGQSTGGTGNGSAGHDSAGSGGSGDEAGSGAAGEGGAGSGGSAGEGAAGSGDDEEFVSLCYFPSEGEPYEVHVRKCDVDLDPESYGECPMTDPDGGVGNDAGSAGDAGGSAGNGEAGSGSAGEGAAGNDGGAGSGAAGEGSAGAGGEAGTDGSAGNGGSAGEGSAGNGEAGSGDETDEDAGVTDDGDGETPPDCGHPHHLVVICHAPPGNPENAHTIHIGAAAVQSHLDQHDGDHVGPCESDEQPNE